MQTYNFEHPLFYPLYFRVNEADCLIEPLIISRWEFELDYIIKKEQRDKQIMEDLANSLNDELNRNIIFDKNLFKQNKKSVCQTTSRYLKRKYR